jgi:predicted extracellular nuclease
MNPSNAPTFATLTVANCNVLNLAAPGHVYYANQEPYSDADYARKVAWLGQQFARLQADVVGVQEVWNLSALKAAVAASGMQHAEALAPGAERGAVGTPCVGLVTRLAVEHVASISEFGPAQGVLVPEIGEQRRFERAVLHAVLRGKQGPRFHVLVAHLKSKRPKFVQGADGRPSEDTSDPDVVARATLRSLLIRAAEAVALRAVVVGITHRTNEPLVLLGDMNDGPHSVTSQMIAATQAVAYDKAARDVALYHAWDVASEPALRRDMAYSHVHQGWPELLDQIWVSEELVASSRFAIGDVRRVEVFNDHLHESRERWRSDHGFVRALLRWRVERVERVERDERPADAQAAR